MENQQSINEEMNWKKVEKKETLNLDSLLKEMGLSEQHQLRTRLKMIQDIHPLDLCFKEVNGKGKGFLYARIALY